MAGRARQGPDGADTERVHERGRENPDTPTPEAEERGRRPVEEEEEEEEDELESIEQRMEWFRDLIGVDDVRRLRPEIAQLRARKSRLRALPRAAADTNEPLESDLEVRARQGETLYASVGRAPTDKTSPGMTGRYVEVTGTAIFSAARLRFRLTADDVRHLYPGTVLVARWDPVRPRWRLIPQSGYDSDKGHAYARISRPGLYTAVGVPTDPGILASLHRLAAMRQCCPEDGLHRRNDIDPSDFPELDILDVVQSPWDVPGTALTVAPVWPAPATDWTNLGPRNVSGRIGALAIDPTDGNVLYAGSTGGGVWKTTDGGVTWTPTMHEEASLAIGGLGIAPSDRNRLYAATGEWTGGFSRGVDPIVSGEGVFRSDDAAATWQPCGSISSNECAAVAVDPNVPNHVFVAGVNALHHSTDGGASWTDVLPGAITAEGKDGAFSDVVIDPSGSRIYAGRHGFGVYRSTDGGITWTLLNWGTHGIDTGVLADAPRIALGRAGTHGSQFVAVKMGDRVYTSVNGGTTFTRVSDVGDIFVARWANVIAVDPTNESILFAGEQILKRSYDGGYTWTKVGGNDEDMHEDMQAIAFDPNNHNRLYVANDGGVWVSSTNGIKGSWEKASYGLVSTHFFVMGVSQTATLRYGGAIQDDDGHVFRGALNWFPLGLKEGGYVEYDPTDEEILYQDARFTGLLKSTDGGTTWTDLNLQNDTVYSEPLAIGRMNHDLLLAIRNDVSVNPPVRGVARSFNGGKAWKNTLTTTEALTAIQLAPSYDVHVYVGSKTGKVWHSADQGQNWNLVSAAPLPTNKVRSIGVDWSDPSRVYVAFAEDGIRHLFRGDLDTAGVATWIDVSGLAGFSLPDLPVTGLALHPTIDDTIFVTTMYTVLRSTDGGDSWETFEDGLPNAFLSDLDVRVLDSSLFACTMGRGIYRRFL